MNYLTYEMFKPIVNLLHYSMILNYTKMSSMVISVFPVEKWPFLSYNLVLVVLYVYNESVPNVNGK